MYINVSPVILIVFDIHVYQCLTSYTGSAWYLCISLFHQLYLYCSIFMYISFSPIKPVVFDIHVYQCFTSYTYWYTWISNTTSITGETLIYMNIKHYKYNWWNIAMHEYQTRQVYLVKHWYTWSPDILVVFGIHVYQCFSIYTCSVWYSCISMFHQLYM
jgi:hypothetical protein